MFRSTRRMLATGFIATLTLCAFAGPGSDPILNDYAGTAVYTQTTTFGGLPVAGQNGVQISQWAIEFATSNIAQVNAFSGVWKRNGKLYRLDCSASATQFLQASVSDPNAQQKFKCSKIALQLGVGITGKLKTNSTWHADLLQFHLATKGSFGCPIAP